MGGLATQRGTSAMRCDEGTLHIRIEFHCNGFIFGFIELYGWLPVKVFKILKLTVIVL